MNSRHNLKLVGGGSRTDVARQQERIEDYLDHLCAPLVGIVPYPERSGLRAESEGHLLALADEYREAGLGPDAATEAALREYGEPWQIGQTFVDAWLQGRPHGPVSRFAGTATLRAFAWFGAVAVLNLLLVEAYALLPGWGTAYPFLVVLAVLSPIVAGCLTGTTVPARSARAVYSALSLLIPHTVATGLLMLPSREGLYFALFQLLFWLPVGCLSTLLSASLAQHHRRLRFLRMAR